MIEVATCLVSRSPLANLIGFRGLPNAGSLVAIFGIYAKRCAAIRYDTIRPVDPDGIGPMRGTGNH